MENAGVNFVLLAAFAFAFGLYLSVDAGESATPQTLDGQRRQYLGALSTLYQALGLTGAEVIFEVKKAALSGLVSDKINQGVKPRDQRSIRHLDVVELNQNDQFTLRTVVDSLSCGLECLELWGVADFLELSLNITKVGYLDPVDCLTGTRYGGWTGKGNASINNGSKGITELVDLALHAQCEKDILDECKRGTVVMDTWVNKTLAFQRWLAANTSISEVQLLGTHNSFNNKADGYGTGDFTLAKILEFISGDKWDFVWAQQWFTMTDQLNMGVRHFMLDPVWFWGAMRLCHCGTTFMWFDDVLHFIEKVLNTTFQFDSNDLGCMPTDRTFEAGVQEIYDWVMEPGHGNEFVMVLINDEGHDADWGHIDLIQNPVQEIMGDLLFTPLDKDKYFPNSWPTPNQIFALGKRVMFTCPERCANDDIFVDMTVPGWDEDTMKYFARAPYPQCGGYKPGDWYLVGGESQIVGPIYNGPAEEGLVIRENLPFLLQCPVSVSEMDIVSPGLITAAVWSWADGYSFENVSSSHCAAMDVKQEARWVTLLCSTSLYHACQSLTNSSQLTLSRQASSWGKSACPSGYTFLLPSTGYQNWWLYHTALRANVTHVWINLPSRSHTATGHSNQLQYR